MKLIAREMYKNNSQKGQTIVIVFMVMLIALVVGITLSTRFLKSMRVLTRSDESSRAVAVAEAAIERLLLLPRSTIEDYTTNGTCGSDCTLTITAEDGQVLSANIALSYTGNTSTYYDVLIHEGDFEEVSLLGYPSESFVDVCWTSDASVYTSYISDDSGEIYADAYAYSPIGTTYVSDNFELASEMHGFANCFTVNTDNTPQMLRIKPYRGSADIKVVPASGQTLPIQGILLTSVGTAGESRREVYVMLTNSTVPAIFDYTIYQFSETDPLSNLGN